MADGLTDEGWTPCALGPAAGAVWPWAAALLRGIEFLRAWASSGWSKADDINDDDELLASCPTYAEIVHSQAAVEVA